MNQIIRQCLPLRRNALSVILALLLILAAVQMPPGTAQAAQRVITYPTTSTFGLKISDLEFRPYGSDEWTSSGTTEGEYFYNVLTKEYDNTSSQPGSYTMQSGDTVQFRVKITNTGTISEFVRVMMYHLATDPDTGQPVDSIIRFSPEFTASGGVNILHDASLSTKYRTLLYFDRPVQPGSVITMTGSFQVPKAPKLITYPSFQLSWDAAEGISAARSMNALWGSWGIQSSITDDMVLSLAPDPNHTYDNKGTFFTGYVDISCPLQALGTPVPLNYAPKVSASFGGMAPPDNVRTSYVVTPANEESAVAAGLDAAAWNAENPPVIGRAHGPALGDVLMQSLLIEDSGTYRYTITQEASAVEDGISRDTRSWDLVIPVRDALGKLEVAPLGVRYICQDGDTVSQNTSAARFENTYTS